MFDVQEKHLTASVYREVAEALTTWSYTDRVQKDWELHARVINMRDSFINAAKCVNESLESYAKSCGSFETTASPGVTGLSEPVDGEGRSSSVTSLEPQSPPPSVSGRGQLDEATLWGK